MGKTQQASRKNAHTQTLMRNIYILLLNQLTWCPNELVYFRLHSVADAKFVSRVERRTQVHEKKQSACGRPLRSCDANVTLIAVTRQVSCRRIAHDFSVSL